jgi:LysM repeat protein
MTEPFTFYRALDPVKGSWDGYGFHRNGESDFLAFVTDAPSAASIHTPEIIADFWTKYVRDVPTTSDAEIARFELADGINRLHTHLQRRSRMDGSGYQATISIARKIGNQLLYCSIGDSMLQLFRNGVLYRLNNSEVWDGSVIIRQSQTLVERQKTELLRFVGDGGDFVNASGISSVTLQAGDRLLFSTDGVEDLLKPNDLIPILNEKTGEMREEFEKIFAQEKLRDDITFVSIEITVDAPYEVEKEVANVRANIDALRKEQSEFRNDLSRLAMPSTRLERIEKNLAQVSQQIQTIQKKLEAMPKSSRVDSSASYSISRSSGNRRGIWLWITSSVALVLLAATAFFLWNRARSDSQNSSLHQPQKKQVEAQVRQQPRAFTPPDITLPSDCDYPVEKGDTLQKIAAKKNLDVDSILRWNPGLKRNSNLKIGQTISLCEGR